MRLSSEIPEKVRSALLFPEVNVEPLGDLILDYLIEMDSEEPYLDYKNTISIAGDSDFARIAKHIFAFSNYGGGYLLVGFKQRTYRLLPNMQETERRQFIPIGLADTYQLDQANLQTKFNAYASQPIEIGYREFKREVDGERRRFAALYIPPSLTVLKPVKDGSYTDARGKEKKAFVKGEVLFRRGTESRSATLEELAWIERRVNRTEYRLSVLSGEPDEIQETVYLNLFPVTTLPAHVWSAEVRPPGEAVLVGNSDYRSCYVWHANRLITFDDPTNEKSPLYYAVQQDSVSTHNLREWFDDQDRRRLLIRLLNKELIFCGLKYGLQYARSKFYFECFGESRSEKWKPRFRSSSDLTVAQRMWASQLNRFIYWHVAVTARFTIVNEKLYLRLSPTIVLTEDGHKSIFGTKEGTVITRLTYNKYNASYLNSLLFWISRLTNGKDELPLAQGRILTSGKPIESKLNVGILADRPVSESIQEIPEVEIGGA